MQLAKNGAITLNPTREDWEMLPMSEEATEALASFFMAILQSDNPEDAEEAKRRFKDVRRRDMQNWLNSQRGNNSGRY